MRMLKTLLSLKITAHFSAISKSLQKRAVHAITKSDKRTHFAPLFSKLKILDIYIKSARFK